MLKQVDFIELLAAAERSLADKTKAYGDAVAYVDNLNKAGLVNMSAREALRVKRLRVALAAQEAVVAELKGVAKK